MVKGNITQWKEIVYFNDISYGTAIKINKWTLRGFILALGIIIPVIFPIPLAAYIAKKAIKENIIWRY